MVLQRDNWERDWEVASCPLDCEVDTCEHQRCFYYLHSKRAIDLAEVKALAVSVVVEETIAEMTIAAIVGSRSRWASVAVVVAAVADSRHIPAGPSRMLIARGL